MAASTRTRLLEADWAIGRERPADIWMAEAEVEPLGIEVAADPAFLALSVLGMATAGQTVEELGIAVGTADILGRSCTRAVDTSCHTGRGFDDEQLLELDQMMPVVAEVVDVHEVADVDR